MTIYINNCTCTRRDLDNIQLFCVGAVFVFKYFQITLNTSYKTDTDLKGKYLVETTRKQARIQTLHITD